jgi:hypothetical protein
MPKMGEEADLIHPNASRTHTAWRSEVAESDINVYASDL